MRGDFSRLTFRPENHFSGVLLQQGRVQLDAEFNEQVAIDAHRDRATTRDVVGPAGAPLDGGGFEVSVASMLRGLAAGTDAWAVGEDGTILRSAGGTGRWEIEDAAAGAVRLNAVDLGTGEAGWAVGDGGTLVRLDGGALTVEAVPGLDADLHGVHSRGSRAWAVGAGGTVVAWDGTAWTPQAQDADVAGVLRDVHFAGAVGAAVGDAGTILMTADGQAWTVHPAPPGTGDLHGVFLADAEHGWAVGAQGTLLAFDGEDWTPHTAAPRVTATLRAIVMTGATDGVAVGDGGTALVLADGTWAPSPTLVTADLRSAAVLPDGSVTAVGDDVAVTLQAGAWTAAPDMPAGAGGPHGRTLTLSAGDLYVDGNRYENDRVTSLDRQPEPPLAAFPQGDGDFGVVLRVQEQLLTATERENLREVALGGPDSATRTRSVWQAGLVELNSGSTACSDVAALVPADGPRGMLRARAVPAAIATSECVVPPNGGYRRLENQLYRVEIHTGTGDAAGATYVWSRENGSVIARLEDVSADAATKTGEVRVSRIGRDAALGFGPEQLVELTDAGRLLRGEPGVLAEIDEIRGTTLILSGVEQAPLTMADFPVDPIVRRWDGRGTVVPGAWAELEDGVSVELAEGPNTDDAFRTGDYWTIPARTLSGLVEWPHTGGVPRFEQRHGPRRHGTPLAVVTRAKGVWRVEHDCRRLFPPLTGLVHLYYAGGDGQSIAPPMPLAAGNHVRLDEPLVVGVVNGSTPVAGAIVEFAVDEQAGAGRLGDGTATAIEVETGADGLARCDWWLDGENRTQAVEARLLDDLGQSPAQVVRFTGQLSAAEWVGYDGSACAALAEVQTVQDAIETVTRLARIAALSGSGEDVVRGGDVKVAVVVTSDCAPVEGATVEFATGPRGTGTIEPASATTDAKGVAACTWLPDPNTATQDLKATLTGVPEPLRLNAPDEVRFVANRTLARNTVYTPPKRCPEMKGVDTVQEAIDRLLGLIPRLYHVSGDGQEGPVGAKIPLRAGVANRCGIAEPRVRFERFERPPGGAADWVLLALADVEDDIAEHVYTVDDSQRQFLRARLADGDRPLGDPVYFTVSRAADGDHGEAGERKLPAVRVLSRGQQIEPREGVEVAFDQVEYGDELFEPPFVIAKKAGLYLATAELDWETAADIALRGVTINRNGEPVARATGPGVRGMAVAQQATALTRLDAGDRIGVDATQRSNGAVVLELATLSLAWLGA